LKWSEKFHLHQVFQCSPHEVWLALDGKARGPKSDSLALRIVPFSGDVLCEGMDEHLIEGLTMKINNLQKAA